MCNHANESEAPISAARRPPSAAFNLKCVQPQSKLLTVHIVSDHIFLGATILICLHAEVGLRHTAAPWPATRTHHLSAPHIMQL
jgi:hypothetical protein